TLTMRLSKSPALVQNRSVGGSASIPLIWRVIGIPLTLNRGVHRSLQVGVEFTKHVPEACPQASQPPRHDGRDVGNCAHHCGDHGLIENGHGCTTLPSDGSPRGVVQSIIRLCVDWV